MMFQKIWRMIQKIKRDRGQALKLWEQVNKEVLPFLQKFNADADADADTQKFFRDSDSIQSGFQAILDELNSPDQLEKSSRIFFDRFFPKDFQNMLENQLLEIIGSEVSVEINYNPEKVNMDYSYKNLFKVKDLFESFLIALIQREKFYVMSPTSSLFILDGKKYSFNEYTEPYFFDPFFGSVDIELKKKLGKFEKNFMIKDPKRITITFTKIQDRQNPDYWKTDKIFTSETKIEQFIEYICKKERADPSVNKQYLDQLKNVHHFNNVGDLLKVKNKDQLLNLPIPKKWINELLIQIEKCHRQQTSCSFKRYKGNEEKLDCLRQSYSHKILRYLFFKINSDNLEELNKAIPYLNKRIVEKAISLIKKQLFNQNLLDDIQTTFRAFSIIPQNGKFSSSHGILFYGPPGTGKSRLTEVLAELMGFHLISKGLSSANFMKELVGGAKGTVEGYFNRAFESPHLICSIAIDEIDPLIQKRENEGGNKGSDETIGKFLSMMGGNQSVENLLVLGSTNLFNKIDDAMVRRFNQNFYVGLPCKEDRKNILKYYHPGLEDIGIEIEFLANMTPNFSGAGLEAIISRIFQRDEEKSWNRKKVLQIVKKVAKNLKLFIGSKTYPELKEDIESDQGISLSFFEKVQRKALLFQKDASQKYWMCYHFNEQEFKDGRIQEKFTFCNHQLFFEQGLNFNSLKAWFSKNIDSFQAIEAGTFEQLKRISKSPEIRTKPTIIFLKIKKPYDNVFTWLTRNSKNPSHNLYFVLHCQNGPEDLSIRKFVQKTVQIKTGRILVDLSQQYPKRMEFQLEQSENGYAKTRALPILGKNKKIINQQEVYPSIFNYLINQNVGFIQVIDNFFFGASNLFEDKECLSAIHAKMEELRNYKSSAIIIDFDSILKLNKSVSHSETGPSKSLSIDRPSIFRELQNIATKLASCKRNKQVWVVLLVKDEDLAKMLREDIQWPESVSKQKENYEQQQKKRQKQQDELTRVCKYCNNFFTEEENKKQKSCETHYGELIKIETCQSMGDMAVQEARFQTEIQNIGKQNPHEYFLYSCCWKKIGDPTCHKMFKHYGGGQEEFDEIAFTREETCEVRQNMRQKFAKSLRNQIKNVKRRL